MLTQWPNRLLKVGGGRIILMTQLADSGEEEIGLSAGERQATVSKGSEQCVDLSQRNVGLPLKDLSVTFQEREVE